MIIYEGLRTNEGNYKYVNIALILHLISIYYLALRIAKIILIITCLIDLLYLYYLLLLICHLCSLFFSGHLGTAARGALHDVKRERPKSRFAAV